MDTAGQLAELGGRLEQLVPGGVSRGRPASGSPLRRPARPRGRAPCRATTSRCWAPSCRSRSIGRRASSCGDDHSLAPTARTSRSQRLVGRLHDRDAGRERDQRRRQQPGLRGDPVTSRPTTSTTRLKPTRRRPATAAGAPPRRRPPVAGDDAGQPDSWNGGEARAAGRRRRRRGRVAPGRSKRMVQPAVRRGRSRPATARTSTRAPPRRRPSTTKARNQRGPGTGRRGST